MQKEKKEERSLEIGDVIYAVKRSEIIAKYTIDRVTRTLAISEAGYERKFNRLTTNGGAGAHLKGDTSLYNYVYYYTETPELKERFVLQSALNKISLTNFPALSKEKIFKIDQIIKAKDPEQKEGKYFIDPNCLEFIVKHKEGDVITEICEARDIEKADFIAKALNFFDYDRWEELQKKEL